MDDRSQRRILERERRRAERLRQLAEGPTSPCISVCRMDEQNDLCAGCFRTIDEIRDWIIMPPEERRAVLARVAERRGDSPAGGKMSDSPAGGTT